MEKTILDWNEYKEIAAKLVSEGCILLKNENDVLPLKENQVVSIFGRIQTTYYKSGTGSGGMVNVPHVVTIPEGLRKGNIVTINEELYDVYRKWEESNPFNEGHGWGTEPWSQVEMPLTDEIVSKAKNSSDVAMVIIGRTAGEEKDIKDEAGAFRLSEDERQMLSIVRKHFDKMIILLNIGSIIDFNFLDEYNPEGIMIVWQGGMVGGEGTARVLDGRVSPSGRLTTTVAYKISDYPSDKYYGDEKCNFYSEDIFVGYRYFETFAKDKVMYPFGYGLSYTSFTRELDSFEINGDEALVKVKVTNTGKCEGKDSVLIFVNAPQGKLGKPARVLAAFGKTGLLSPGESQVISIEMQFITFASYDDTGKTGNQSCFVLEMGQYNVFIGGDVREAKKAFDFIIEENRVLKRFEKALWPEKEFKRMVATENGSQTELIFENVPTIDYDEEKRRQDGMINEIPFCENDYTLEDVAANRCTLEEFVAGLTDDDLIAIVRGEGMGSSLVTPGTASAFAGVTQHLRSKGVPAICCDDGPSGMRLDCGAKAFSLPSGTMLASTFNTELVTKIYEFTSMEMCRNKVDCLLGPGMNIHRHPLNGRNFEYFSEDPYVTGMMGIANLKGLAKYGNFGTVKHFCCNNQEYKRLYVNAEVSERALREIYLKGFEMAVYSGYCQCVMTTYGAVNGLWTASNFDLNWTILRKQWNFDGIVMTDWWSDMNKRGKEQCKTDFASMVRSCNDLYMCVTNGENMEYGENTFEEYKAGNLKKCELQKVALNVLGFALKTQSFARTINKHNLIEVINEDKDDDYIDLTNLEYINVDGEVVLPFSEKPSRARTNYIFPLMLNKIGFYEITVTGSSTLSEVAQLPVTLYYTGVPFLTFVFSGSEGKDVSITKKLYCHNAQAIIRVNVGKSGLDLKDIKFKWVEGERPPRNF